MLNYLKKNYLKVGVLGGSFDPPHKGHLTISKMSIKKFKLDFVIWLITKKNPLKKKPYYDLSSRVKLSKKIVKNFKKKIKIEYVEEKIKSSSTYDSLKFLKKLNKKIEYIFIIGADNLIQLHKWNNWKNITNLAKIAVFDREDYSMKALNSIAAKKLNKKDWTFINFKKVNISSSKIKKI